MGTTIKRTWRLDQSAHRKGRQSECFAIKIADPLSEWLDLVNPSRERQQKRNRKQGNQRGRIDAYLLAELAMLAAIVLLLVGGLCHG